MTDNIVGLTTSALLADEVETIIGAVENRRGALAGIIDTDSPVYLYGWGDAGYLVGAASGEDSWEIATVSGTNGAELDIADLSELRVYTVGTEIVVDPGSRCGAIRRSTDDETFPPGCAPRIRSYLVAAAGSHRPGPTSLLSTVADRGGTTTVIPYRTAADRHMFATTREYFTHDDVGAVRVAAVCWEGFR